MPDPGQFELLDVGTIDLVELRIVGTAVVTMVDLPVTVAGFAVGCRRGVDQWID